MAVVVRVTIAVQGRVQGVGCRVACIQCAHLLGLRGWIHNHRDGAIETFLADPEANVPSMREWMWGGSDSAQVTQLDVVTGDHETPVPGFKIRPTV